MSDLVLPGSVIGLLLGIFFVARNTVAGYRAASAEYAPRAECDLKHAGLVVRIARLETDIQNEQRARHDLRDAFQPIAVKVGKLEVSVAALRDTVGETRDLVKALVERN